MEPPSSEKLSILRALRARFPPLNPWTLASQGGLVVLGNAYIAWLAFEGLASPASLVIFSFCEIFVVWLTSWIELIPIPKAARGTTPPSREG